MGREGDGMGREGEGGREGERGGGRGMGWGERGREWGCVSYTSNATQFTIMRTPSIPVQMVYGIIECHTKSNAMPQHGLLATSLAP